MSRNAFAGYCYRCGELVKPNAGHFERYLGAWRVQHAECAIHYRGSDRNAKGPRPAPLSNRFDGVCILCTRDFRKPRKSPEQKRCSPCIQQLKLAKQQRAAERAEGVQLP